MSSCSILTASSARATKICQTLGHEMVHVKQHAFGQPSARGYHNVQWAQMMKAIGLQPSSTGMVGGKETGQHMSNYLIPDGPFEKSYDKLAATGWRLNSQSAPRPGQRGGINSKTKFTCPACGQNAGETGPGHQLHPLLTADAGSRLIVRISTGSCRQFVRN